MATLGSGKKRRLTTTNKNKNRFLLRILHLLVQRKKEALVFAAYGFPLGIASQRTGAFSANRSPGLLFLPGVTLFRPNTAELLLFSQ
jgi:hypothetical protein